MRISNRYTLPFGRKDPVNTLLVNEQEVSLIGTSNEVAIELLREALRVLTEESLENSKE